MKNHSDQNTSDMASYPRTLWFQQLKVIFILHNIEDDNFRYIHLQASINRDTLRAVCDFSTNPPEPDKYSALKSSIIHKYAESREDEIIYLIERISLDDR